MLRSGLLLLGWLAASGLIAEVNPGLHDAYLTETVRRGLPVLAEPDQNSVPFWPLLEGRVRNLNSVHPDGESALVQAWMLLHQQQLREASGVLEGLWAQPPASKATAEAWFSTLGRLELHEKLLTAWQLWELKYLSPRVLLEGVRAASRSQPELAISILKQAVVLYPQDRRFLFARLALGEMTAETLPLTARDSLQGGLSSVQILSLLRQNPAARDILLRAGYPEASLTGALSHDYAELAASNKVVPAANRVWGWDQDGDGSAEQSVVTASSALWSWSRGDYDPQGESWSVDFRRNTPVRLVEARRDSRWVLTYEAYPAVKTLTYSYSQHQIVYHFPPFAISVPLAPESRLSGDSAFWPWQMGGPAGLSLAALVRKAYAVETWEKGRLIKSLAMAQGQAWLAIEDTDADGQNDQWSFYRGGQLDRVYRNPAGAGASTLQEVYHLGEYVAFLADPLRRGQTLLAEFPVTGVQLWDPEGRGVPFQRWFRWEDAAVQVQAYSGESLPWNSMPVWASRP